MSIVTIDNNDDDRGSDYKLEATLMYSVAVLCCKRIKFLKKYMAMSYHDDYSG